MVVYNRNVILLDHRCGEAVLSKIDIVWYTEMFELMVFALMPRSDWVWYDDFAAQDHLLISSPTERLLYSYCIHLEEPMILSTAIVHLDLFLCY